MQIFQPFYLHIPKKSSTFAPKNKFNSQKDGKTEGRKTRSGDCI